MSFLTTINDLFNGLVNAPSKVYISKQSWWTLTLYTLWKWQVWFVTSWSHRSIASLHRWIFIRFLKSHCITNIQFTCINHSRSRFVLGLKLYILAVNFPTQSRIKCPKFKPKTNLDLEWFKSNQFIHLKEKALKFRLVTKHSLVSM